jgi:hypothetical protein
MVNIEFFPVYNSFRRNLDYIWDDEKPESKNALKLLMFQRGFRTKKEGERKQPTDIQVEIAWDYLKRRYAVKTLEEIFFRQEKYKKHVIYRATTNYTYNNKKYRKGQFMPKGVKDD